MTAIPEVLDALVTRWRTAQDLSGLRPDQVHDGPPTTYVGNEGVAVGASRNDNAIEFAQSATDVAGGQADRFRVTCQAWSSSGDIAMKPRRDRVDAIIDALDSHLAVDRTLGGAVSTAWIVGGAFIQEQNRGALVIAEFSVSVRRF